MKHILIIDDDVLFKINSFLFFVQYVFNLTELSQLIF